MKSELIEKVTSIVERAGRADGIEAVEVQWLGSGKNRLLRIYIDKPDGVTHKDCEMISQYVGTVLDAEDIVPGGSYTLEVSSPGVERKLARPSDYERFTGKKIKMVLRRPLQEGAPGPTYWEGVISGFQEGVVTLQPLRGDPVRIPLEIVERATLKFEW